MFVYLLNYEHRWRQQVIPKHRYVCQTARRHTAVIASEADLVI
jgi:hypothetical protein